MRQLEVGVGREVAPLEPRLGLAHVVDRADRQRPQARQPAQRQPVGLARARQLLRVRDDDLLGRSRRDGEHPRRELVARLGLQQRRVLLVVQEVFVGDARRLLLDDLPFLPAIADPHREPADGRAGWQRDPEAPFTHPVLRVAEGQVQLGEGERVVDRRVGRQRHQLEPGAVRRGQADGRRRRDDDAPGARVVAGDEGDENQDQEAGRKAESREAELGGHTGPDARPAIWILNLARVSPATRHVGRLCSPKAELAVLAASAGAVHAGGGRAGERRRWPHSSPDRRRRTAAGPSRCRAAGRRRAHRPRRIAMTAPSTVQVPSRPLLGDGVEVTDAWRPGRPTQSGRRLAARHVRPLDGDCRRDRLPWQVVGPGGPAGGPSTARRSRSCCARPLICRSPAVEVERRRRRGLVAEAAAGMRRMRAQNCACKPMVGRNRLIWSGMITWPPSRVDRVELQDLGVARDVGKVGVDVHHEAIEDEAALDAQVDLVVGRELLIVAAAVDDRRPAPGVEMEAQADRVVAAEPGAGDEVQDVSLVPIGAARARRCRRSADSRRAYRPASRKIVPVSARRRSSSAP